MWRRRGRGLAAVMCGSMGNRPEGDESSPMVPFFTSSGRVVAVPILAKEGSAEGRGVWVEVWEGTTQLLAEGI